MLRFLASALFLLGAAAVPLRAQHNIEFTADQTATGTIEVTDYLLQFTANSSAGSASIINGYAVDFGDTSTAANASIINNNTLSFYANASAGSASIVNYSQMDFYHYAGARTASITNHGTITFHDYANPESVMITNGSDGLIYALSSAGSLAGSGTIQKGATLNLHGLASTTFSGELTGHGDFIKHGASTFNLTGHMLAQWTTLRGGTLLVSNTTGLGISGGMLMVETGTVLGGNGVIGTAATQLNSFGHLAPGEANSPGTLTFAGSLNLYSDSNLDFQLGTSSDLIAVTPGTFGASTFSAPNGGVRINLTDSGGFAPGNYTLIDFTGSTLSSLTLSDFVLGDTIAGYDYSLAFNGSTLELTAFSAIPEPSTYAALLGVGACVAVAWRKRAPSLAALRRRRS